MNHDLENLATEYFGYQTLHPYQRDVITGLLQGENILTLAATGGGKSLCYQLPSIFLEGLVIVVSPLISLMIDQVDNLNRLTDPRLKVDYLSSFKTQKEIKSIYNRMDCLDLLYVSPERFSEDFLKRLNAIPLSLFAIDEVHCVSHWGHDFRPKYRKLSVIVDKFPQIPRLGLTATADSYTRKDVMNLLGLQKIYSTSMDRKNLTYRVKYRYHLHSQIEAVLNSYQEGSGIIYCLTKSEVESLFKYLDNRFPGLIVYYHAGLSKKLRKHNHNVFTTAKRIIMVATVAFGMGIDRPDIRFVIHTSLPRSLESYLQESGRAGRDGLASESIVFYHEDDVKLMKFLISNSFGNQERHEIEYKRLISSINYCRSTTCRREHLLGYLGENCDCCGQCDVCLGEITGRIAKDFRSNERVKAEKPFWNAKQREFQWTKKD